MEAVLDESTFNQVGGITISEQINRHVSPQFLPSDRDRIVGKAQIHKRLRINEETGKPGILIFNNCTNIIRELQTIPMSKTISELWKRLKGFITDIDIGGIAKKVAKGLWKSATSWIPGMGGDEDDEPVEEIKELEESVKKKPKSDREK